MNAGRGFIVQSDVFTWMLARQAPSPFISGAT